MTLYTHKDTIGTRRVYEGKIFNVRVDECRKSAEQQIFREVVEHPGGVVVAAQPQADLVFLVRQYRYVVDADLLELPAGRLDQGEEPLQAARRELREEIGYSAENWELVAKMYAAPGFCNELLCLYRACGLSWVGISPDEDEEIEPVLLKVEEAWQMVQQGQIVDAKTIAGLALLRTL